ncbi:BnaUnng02740D [Brassica napus]|uniref:BnaUnng02740D protein n=1 Tax=Brassica napus TaxID=3708 RepID=A0A078JNU5_BRANA|nr:BnaUnng02740D [Brassica napus]
MSGLRVQWISSTTVTLSFIKRRKILKNVLSDAVVSHSAFDALRLRRSGQFIIAYVVGQIQSVQGSDLKDAAVMTRVVSDAYQATGCYNFLCSGFIQINSNIAVEASISPVSGYCNLQYDISILIWKDPKEDTESASMIE